MAVERTHSTTDSPTLPDVLLRRGLPAALGIVESIRRDVARFARSLPSRDPASIIRRARSIIASHEPLLARTMRDSLLYAWLTSAQKLTRAARIRPPASHSIETPIGSVRPLGAPTIPPLRPPFGPLASASGEPEPSPIVRFPQIERAAQDLERRRVVTPTEFAALDQDARRTAFTVARIQSVDALQRIQRALVTDVRQGGTLQTFRREVVTAVDGALTGSQVETVYRTQVMAAYSAGQRTILEHPLVSDEFPYLLWTATHDSRVRPEHLAMEKWGQNGTAVYRADDPMWAILYPPAAWNCRCHAIALTIEDAAKHGSREAARWLRTGQPPLSPAFARQPYPIVPPPGWPTHGGITAITP